MRAAAIDVIVVIVSKDASVVGNKNGQHFEMLEHNFLKFELSRKGIPPDIQIKLKSRI